MMPHAGFFDPIWEFSGLISQEQYQQTEWESWEKNNSTGGN